MKCFKAISLFLILLAGSQCADDQRSLILGTWEGRAWGEGQDEQLVMYLSFDGGTLTTDYSPGGGGKFSAPYRFKDERTIETSLYPDNLVVERQPDGGIRFRAGMKALRESVDVIYHCKFSRAAN